MMELLGESPDKVKFTDMDEDQRNKVFVDI